MRTADPQGLNYQEVQKKTCEPLSNSCTSEKEGNRHEHCHTFWGPSHVFESISHSCLCKKKLNLHELIIDISWLHGYMVIIYHIMDHIMVVVAPLLLIFQHFF